MPDCNNNSVEEELDFFLRLLYPLCRSITGEANRKTLRELQKIVPLTIVEIPTGTKVYDWIIPEEWVIKSAWISDSSGDRIVDFSNHNLHVVSYSTPVNCKICWADLKPHIHKHPKLGEAIPYRTSYYKRDWGFCVTWAQYETLVRAKGPLQVHIDSELKPGSLSYGEYLLPGISKKEILVSCYICHPSMANDSLSGVLIASFLARYLSALPNRYWSYRFIFVPETIGAISYCSMNESAMEAIDCGLVITTVGGPGKFGYKKTWQSDHWLNQMIKEVLEENHQEFIAYPFDIHGSDERQYSSQGFRINVATISKDRYYEYKEYHSSSDDLSFVTASQLAESLTLYQKLLLKIEGIRLYRSTVMHGEVMLSRHGLYPETGGAQKPKLAGGSEIDLVLWLLFLCDGVRTVESIAIQLGIEAEILYDLVVTLESKKLLELV